jgi:hypothetical protein
VNTNDDLKKVVKNIYKLYNDYLNDDSILIVCLTGRNNKQNIENNDYLKGKCFLKHKKKEADNLENEIEQLYFKRKKTNKVFLLQFFIFDNNNKTNYDN